MRASLRRCYPPMGEPEHEPIWCGFCRKGQHRQCQALKGARKAMHPELGPIQPEEYCQCSCDPTQPKIPGQGQAREWPEEGTADG
jgi:hypothetical protein